MVTYLTKTNCSGLGNYGRKISKFFWSLHSATRDVQENKVKTNKQRNKAMFNHSAGRIPTQDSNHPANQAHAWEWAEAHAQAKL